MSEKKHIIIDNFDAIKKQLTFDDISKYYFIQIVKRSKDNPDMKSISRELLLSILFFANREKYLALYEIYKDIQIQRTTTGNKKYIAKITEEMLVHLRKFKPVNMYVKI